MEHHSRIAARVHFIRFYLWYRNGKFRPAVDVCPYIPDNDRPVIVVPRYRLEAWQAGARMPNTFQALFETKELHGAAVGVG